MKRILILLLFVCCFVRLAFAQKDSLAVDENNKLIYYQVVEQPGLTADTLYSRALYFFDKAYPPGALRLTTADQSGFKLSGTGAFEVSRKSALTSHPDGSVAFTIQVDVKDGKYRYWLTDFVLNPYQRDRYNNFVSVPGIFIPLENRDNKISKKDLTGYLDGVLSNSRKIGTTLKQYMQKTSSLKKENKIKKISTKDW
ncbi:MAG TPA: DUF4468 domain-containing protein [Mucilaginibacter sp.]|nr:DUF4468 domain-containing protein [Mucilaginibacter sp.]